MIYKSMSLFCLQALLVLSGCGSGRKSLSEPVAPAPTRDGRWIQDIDYVATNLERIHPKVYANVSKDQFQAFRGKLIDDVPELSDKEIVIRMAEMLALLQDAHTSIPLKNDARFDRLPIEFIADSEGYKLVAVPKVHEKLLLGKLEAIGETRIDDVVSRLGRFISAENEIHRFRSAKYLLRAPSILKAAGICEEEFLVKYTLRSTDGELHQIQLQLDESPPELSSIKVEQPRLVEKYSREHYAFEVLEDPKVVYWQYNVCYEQDGKPFKEFSKQLSVALEAPEVERLIIDLRANGGGSELVARSFLQRLSQHRLNRRGGIIVLIGANTFSCAKGNFLTLRDSSQIVSMGQPMRQSANTFGEVIDFNTPNYNLPVRFSTKHFVRGSETERVIRPEFEIPFRIEDWMIGQDKTLQAAIEFQP